MRIEVVQLTGSSGHAAALILFIGYSRFLRVVLVGFGHQTMYFVMST